MTAAEYDARAAHAFERMLYCEYYAEHSISAGLRETWRDLAQNRRGDALDYWTRAAEAQS